MDGKLRQMTALYLMKGEKMLLLYRIGSRVVAPSWCGIGGHLEPEEIGDARAGVLREVREEIGLTDGDMENLTMRYVTLRYTKGEIRCNFYFFAELKDGVNLSMYVEHLAACAENEIRGRLTAEPQPGLLPVGKEVPVAGMVAADLGKGLLPQEQAHPGKFFPQQYGQMHPQHRCKQPSFRQAIGAAYFWKALSSFLKSFPMQKGRRMKEKQN